MRVIYFHPKDNADVVFEAWVDGDENVIKATLEKLDRDCVVLGEAHFLQGADTEYVTRF